MRQMYFVKFVLNEGAAVRIINLCNVTNITHYTYEDGTECSTIINYIDGKSDIFLGRDAETVFGSLSQCISKENETKILNYGRNKYNKQ